MQVREGVAHVIAGKNASVLAYGQTSSGKTYTMLGPCSADSGSWVGGCDAGEGGSNGGLLTIPGGGVAKEHGVVPRALAELLAAKFQAEGRGEETMSIECSYLQVYVRALFWHA